MSSVYGQKREIKKHFKVNEEEEQKIQELAKNFPDESKLFRYMLFENNKDNPFSYEDKKEIMELLSIVRAEMSRVGGNLNQLARTFNQSGKISFKNLQAAHEDLQFQQADLMESLKTIISKLS